MGILGLSLTSHPLHSTMTHMNITPITITRKGHKYCPEKQVVVSAMVPHHFLKVGELYVSTKHNSMCGYTTAIAPWGNSVGSGIVFDSAQEVAEDVAANYEDYFRRCKRVAAPIPQSYLDRYGTGME